MNEITVLISETNMAAYLSSSSGRGGALISQVASVLSDRIGEGMENREIEVKGTSEPLEAHVMRVEPSIQKRLLQLLVGDWFSCS